MLDINITVLQMVFLTMNKKIPELVEIVRFKDTEMTCTFQITLESGVLMFTIQIVQLDSLGHLYVK